MAIHTVVFDMGGVLVKHVQIAGAIAARYGIDEETMLADYAAYDGPIMDGLLQPKDYWIHASARFHLDPDADPICEMFHPIPNEPVLKTIRDLKERGGVRLLLGSNTCAYHWQVIDGMVHLSSLLDKCYLSFEMHVSKPQPEFFRTILGEEGIHPEETLFVDDIKRNVESAQSTGMQVLHFQDTDFWPADTKLRALLGLDYE